MSQLARHLTVSELSQRILDMAQTGVYRESLFETFQPVATKQTIRHAIRHAKQFGLYSVAQLRDAELGTYYQLDLAKYDALKPGLQSSLPLHEADVVQRMTEAVVMIRVMLTIAGGSAISLLTVGGFCWFTGHSKMALALIPAAIGAIGVWGIQKVFAKKFI